MKKIIILLSALILAFTLVSCDKEEAEKEDKTISENVSGIEEKVLTLRKMCDIIPTVE